MVIVATKVKAYDILKLNLNRHKDMPYWNSNRDQPNKGGMAKARGRIQIKARIMRIRDRLKIFG